MTRQLILILLMAFGALQASANAFERHSSNKDEKRQPISFEINRTLGNAHNTDHEDAQYFQQTPAAVFHFSAFAESIPDLIVISVLDFSDDDRKIFSHQLVPRIRLFEVLFRTAISPNAP